MEFDTNFVYNVWNPKLDGMKVFYADNIEELKSCVESGDLSKMDYIHYSENEASPFAPEREAGDLNCKFVYFDPQYKSKIANQK